MLSNTSNPTRKKKQIKKKSLAYTAGLRLNTKQIISHEPSPGVLPRRVHFSLAPSLLPPASSIALSSPGPSANALPWPGPAPPSTC